MQLLKQMRETGKAEDSRKPESTGEKMEEDLEDDIDENSLKRDCEGVGCTAVTVRLHMMMLKSMSIIY